LHDRNDRSGARIQAAERKDVVWTRIVNKFKRLRGVIAAGLDAYWRGRVDAVRFRQRLGRR
jgi:hypothetical protein